MSALDAMFLSSAADADGDAHADADMTGTGVPSGGPSRVVKGLRRGWQLFGAIRRTRPFWGGLWMIVAGFVIIRMSYVSIGFVIGVGWNSAAALVLGGALILFGLVAWFAPHYAPLLGLFGVIVALVAFVNANLGGYLIGTVLGILGGSMTWGWGEKRPRRPRPVRRPSGRHAAGAGPDEGDDL